MATADYPEILCGKGNAYAFWGKMVSDDRKMHKKRAAVYIETGEEEGESSRRGRQTSYPNSFVVSCLNDFPFSVFHKKLSWYKLQKKYSDFQRCLSTVLDTRLYIS